MTAIEDAAGEWLSLAGGRSYAATEAKLGSSSKTVSKNNNNNNNNENGNLVIKIY